MIFCRSYICHILAKRLFVVISKSSSFRSHYRHKFPPSLASASLSVLFALKRRQLSTLPGCCSSVATITTLSDFRTSWPLLGPRCCRAAWPSRSSFPRPSTRSAGCSRLRSGVRIRLELEGLDGCDWVVRIHPAKCQQRVNNDHLSVGSMWSLWVHHINFNHKKWLITIIEDLYILILA